MKRKLIKSLAVIALLVFSMPVMAYATPSNPAKETTVINTNELTKEGVVPVESWEDCDLLTDQILKQTEKTDISKVTYEDLSKVKVISLFDLGGITPDIIFQCTNLESLNLSTNKISDSQLDKIATLKNLKTLDLGMCGLTKIPESIFTLEKLESLHFFSNNISEIPSAIKELKNLKELSFRFNKISQVSSEIYSLTNLELLDFSGNPIKTLSPEVANLKNLVSFGLEYCELAEVPNVFKDMNRNLIFSVSYNSLVKLPEIKPTQKIVYFSNFISCPYENSNLGNQVKAYKTVLNVNIGNALERSAVNSILNFSDVNDIHDKLKYNPHDYEILLSDNKIIKLGDVKNLPAGKYNVRIKLAGSDLSNTFAITPEVITLNIIDQSTPTKPSTPNDNTNNNNNNTDKPSVKPTVKPAETGKGSLPYTGGIASLATILGGSGLIGIGTILYKKKK